MRSQAPPSTTRLAVAILALLLAMSVVRMGVGAQQKQNPFPGFPGTPPQGPGPSVPPFKYTPGRLLDLVPGREYVIDLCHGGGQLPISPKTIESNPGYLREPCRTDGSGQVAGNTIVGLPNTLVRFSPASHGHGPYQQMFNGMTLEPNGLLHGTYRPNTPLPSFQICASQAIPLPMLVRDETGAIRGPTDLTDCAQVLPPATPVNPAGKTGKGGVPTGLIVGLGVATGAAVAAGVAVANANKMNAGGQCGPNPDPCAAAGSGCSVVGDISGIIAWCQCTSGLSNYDRSAHVCR